MASPSLYGTDYLDSTIDRVRRELREKLEGDPGFFGDSEGIRQRIRNTLDKDAPKGTLVVRPGIEADTAAGIMRTVDLTILDRGALKEDVEQVARRAAREHCATVCVYPEYVSVVSRVMSEQGITDIGPIAVVGFPSVPAPTQKATLQTVQQTKAAIAEGAREIDMVLPTSFREDKDNDQEHYRYIKAVVDAAHERNVPVKVILETAYLNDEQIIRASILCKIAGADWVKTSTGFAEIDKFAANKDADEKGATPHVVALMRRTVGDISFDDNGNEKPMGVKASGGVRNREQAIAMLRAGADRIGASNGLDVRTPTERSVPDSPASFQGSAAKPAILSY